MKATNRASHRARIARRPAADLHVHTTHSDGGCSPCAVVQAAASVGLSALAITDHDTVSALPIARREADFLGIELISGIELTAERAGREIHLLGHFVREDHPALLATSESLRLRRKLRIETMTSKLEQLGLQIDLERLRQTFPRATLGRKHLADWLTSTGQVAGPREAFSLYLGDQGPASVAKPRVPWREAIALIRDAGGVAGLAHPPYDLHQSTLREFAEAGLGAIEIAGPGTDARLSLRWRGWADGLGLAAISGSDFHSPDRPGRWVGSVATYEADLDRLRSLRDQVRIGPIEPEPGSFRSPAFSS